MAVARPRARAQQGMSDPPGRGLGDARVTVKGAVASTAQRRVITGILGKAEELGASRRVMVACIMAATQESSCQSLGYGDAAGPDSRGPFQQRDPWGPLSQRLDPAGSAELFLTVDRGPGVRGWRAVHGSLKNAPGNLSHAINQVQISAYPDAYAQWQQEAERTVEAWQGSPTTAGETTAETDRRYTFSRGEKGQPEDSWACAGRLAEEVGWSRWAFGNTLLMASDDELRRQGPAVTIRGGEQWIVAGPRVRASVAEPFAEMELTVLADRWTVAPGACVMVATGGPLDGRWLVDGVTGQSLTDPRATITLRRPTQPLPEPAAESSASPSGVGDATPTVDGSVGERLLAACKIVSDSSSGYTLGAGHRGANLDSLAPTGDFDCSSSTSWVLRKAGMFGQSTALWSGALAQSWGEAGRGRVFTVWANTEHVWIELHGMAPWLRFDTSPHGDSRGSGPRLRTTARSTSGFSPRRWRGA